MSITWSRSIGYTGSIIQARASAFSRVAHRSRIETLLNKLLYGTVVVIVLTALCVVGLDVQVAEFILLRTGRAFLFSHTVASLPDLLLATVIAVCSASWAGYFLLVQKGTSDRSTRLFRVLGTALPIAFVAKGVLKWIFGRVDTRTWLVHPETYSFHWFHGGVNFQGFPSGHMLVFTPLFLAMWNYSPRLRPVVLAGWLGLAVALLVTEYHFLGDLIAGSYLGYLIYFGVDRASATWSGSLGGSADQGR